MSDERSQADFLGDIAAEATGSAGVPDDVTIDDAVPNELADQVEAYDDHAERRDEHLHDDADQGTDDQALEQDNGRKQHVPLGALQKERAARQQAQAQLAQMQAQLQQFQAQHQQALAQQQAAQQQAEIPAFVDDPEGHLEGLKKQFVQELEALRQGQQQQVQEQQIRAQVADAGAFIRQVEADFRQTNPDYDRAFEHVQTAANQQLRQLYPQATEAELATVQQGALLSFITQCRAEGRNPCQEVFAKAQAMGFQGSHRAARKAPTSLSDVSGTSRTPDQRGNVRAKDIAGMSNEEFDRLFESMRNAERPQFGF
ncbi:hypothetical protein [Pseudomonas asiatica]|uniref:hypothetical protein n=1 Tax=Pseudomonas asiatica TaxID=2219225 RepID=UPI0018D96382|nr:hypothetical protein [Pseudomonas asiatica]MBH3378364.1 hypothetical protein [Pseudomonas asiatica]